MATPHERRPHPAAHDLPAHRPCPELADALRSQTQRIIQTWVERVRVAVPKTQTIPPDQLQDGLPDILAGMADALASAHAGQAAKLMERSPSQGIARFQQHYDVRELVLEDRLL